MNKFAYGIIFLLLPLYFLIMLPIEYPIWKEYKRGFKNVPNYFKFFWIRCVTGKFNHDNYKNNQ